MRTCCWKKLNGFVKQWTTVGGAWTESPWKSHLKTGFSQPNNSTPPTWEITAFGHDIKLYILFKYQSLHSILYSGRGPFMFMKLHWAGQNLNCHTETAVSPYIRVMWCERSNLTPKYLKNNTCADAQIEIKPRSSVNEQTYKWVLMQKLGAWISERVKKGF